jgi:hypothetical protein
MGTQLISDQNYIFANVYSASSIIVSGSRAKWGRSSFSVSQAKTQSRPGFFLPVVIRIFATDIKADAHR